MNHPATEVSYTLTRQRLDRTPSVMHRLLPNELRVVDAKAQAHLKQRYLLPYLKALTAYLLALRAQLDPLLHKLTVVARNWADHFLANVRQSNRWKSG
tara:strand:- start:1528 stop:1821 length:294 start_codon:yes stop_codon:yes gene_type:complete